MNSDFASANRVRGIGGGARVGRALARIGDAEEAGDHEHFAQYAMRVRRDQHARELHVHRQLRHRAADGGELAIRIDRAEFAQLLPAVGHRARIGRFEEGNFSISPSPSASMQDHPGQRGAADFRIGELRPREEVGFRIQADAGAGRDAAATARALVGAGLRDGLDVQAVEFLPRAVALDPRHARIDHVMDARHRQRGFGDVGREHDAPLRAGMEHAVLVARGQPRVQRQHLGMAVLALLQRLVRVADLAFARQKDQHVADALVFWYFIAGGDDVVEHGNGSESLFRRSAPASRRRGSEK